MVAISVIKKGVASPWSRVQAGLELMIVLHAYTGVHHHATPLF